MIKMMSAYIPRSSDLHLRHHLKGEEAGDEGIAGERDVNEVLAPLERFWRVEAHRKHGDQRTHAQHTPHLGGLKTG